MDKEVVIRVSGVGKKYCRSLRRSMLYGVRDIATDALGLRSNRASLRPDEFWSLQDVSVEVSRGECVGVIGPNGAGKSTLFKLLNGIMWPDAGSIKVRGRMGALIEIGAGFHPLLTGRENIYIGAAILGLTTRETDAKLDEIIAFAELDDFIDTPVKHYSSGMYVRLGFAVAASVSPEILLVDEVLAVGDLRFRHRCFQHIKRLSEHGTAILVVTHSMTDLLRLAQRTVVLDRGRCAFDGNTEGGIAAYQACLSRRGISAAGAANASWEVEVEAVRIHGGDGLERDRFATAEDVWIELDVRGQTRQRPLELRLEFESPSYGPIATVSSLSSRIEIAPQSGELVRVAVRLDRLPLLRGHYSFNVHIFALESGEFLGSQYGVGAVNIVQADLDAPHRHLLALSRDWYGWNSQQGAYAKAPVADGSNRQQHTFHG